MSLILCSTCLFSLVGVLVHFTSLVSKCQRAFRLSVSTLALRYTEILVKLLDQHAQMYSITGLDSIQYLEPFLSWYVNHVILAR